MASETLLLTSSSLLMLLLFQTSLANPSPSCTSSSCGIIRNISYPFRLKDDPTNCGDSRYEIACENNVVTSIYLNSHKYYVKDINYCNSSNYCNSRFRVVDASINNDDICSFPNSSLYLYNFTSDLGLTDLYPFGDNRPINLMSCPTPLKNSSLFTDLTHDCAASLNSSHPRFTYIKVGDMRASEVPETCRVDLTVMTSWKFNDWNNNVSLSEIHHSLLYGFQLAFFESYKPKKLGIFEDFLFARGLWILVFTIGLLFALVSPPVLTIIGFTTVAGLSFLAVAEFLYIKDGGFLWNLLWILVLIVGLLCALVCPPVMTIIGLTSVAGLSYFVIRELFDIINGGRITSDVIKLVIEFIILAPRIIIFPLALCFIIYKFRRRNLSLYNTIERFLQSDNKLTPIRYSYSDIKKMTRKFQDKLGEGGYGSVYKGRLRSGHDVAVKMLGKSGANGQDFMNEIGTIGRIHHVNVVKLVGYCAQGTKRALVFDFMSNGSLEKFLFNREKMNSLNWDKKFGIAVGIARGIEYLHLGCDIQILHFDIKPHNILLDDKFVPKITDFGLAKLCSTENNIITMTAARGTIGYVAPELINRGIGAISYKADVYSFGMLLMEMTSLNKHITGNNCDSSQYFPNWIYDCFNQGRDIEIENIDENDNNDSTRKLARKITIVALWCIQMNPDDRPPMNKVLEMLEGDVELLQIPNYPSLPSTQIVDEIEITCSIDSLPLVCHDDLSSSVEITVEE